MQTAQGEKLLAPGPAADAPPPKGGTATSVSHVVPLQKPGTAQPVNAPHDPALMDKTPPPVHVTLLLLLTTPVEITALREESVALTVPMETLVSDAHAAPTEKEQMAEQPAHVLRMAIVEAPTAHALLMAIAEQPDAPLCGVQPLKPEKWVIYVIVL